MTTLPFPKNNYRSAAFDKIKKLSFRKGHFTLASGVESTFYLDMKPSMMDPEGGNAIAHLILDRIDGLKVEYIGGLVMGAVPLITPVTMIAFNKGKRLPGFFVRQKPKDHGTKKLVEGPSEEEIRGKRVVVIDDVTTTGGSALEAVEAVRGLGAEIVLVLSIVDREEGAVQFYKDRGIEFDSLFKVSEFIVDD